MGAIRTTPQVDQNGQQSGQVSVEITYGGKESPFGGIDASAPPAYIAPNCFISSDGFLVVDNKLVIFSLAPVTLPTLYGGVSNVTTIKIGNFYTSTLGYINYALGVNTNTILSNPNGRIYTFYITAWQTINEIPTVIGNDVLTIKALDVIQPAVAASLTVNLAQGQATGFTDSGNIILNCYNNAIATTNVSQSYAPGNTIGDRIPLFVANVNALSATTLFTAAPTSDGLGIILTATTPGAAGNLLGINDVSNNTTTPTNPSVFYFPLGFSPATNFEGGKDATTIPVETTFHHPFVVAVGGTAYFANLGPYILKYAGPGFFDISSIYAGYKFIGKFAGSLIGLGVIPALLSVVQNSDMIFAWSATNNLDEWSPVTASGNVTGAGFTQLADIESPLRNLIVTNNTAFIIRSQGISYATALGSGRIPFAFQHIALSDEGEGAQNARLVCQYNETGAFVGNSDVFEISGGVSSIGVRINSLLLPALQISNGPVDSNACVVTIGGKTFPIAGFLVDSTIYYYNPDNKTWMLVVGTMPAGLTIRDAYLEITTNYNAADAIQRQAQYNLVYTGTIAGTNTTLMYSVVEGYNARVALNATPTIVFPQEELLFGRDVTIDAIYISMNAITGFNSSLAFYINDIFFASYTFQPSFWTTLDGPPVEVQIFPDVSLNGTGVFTARSPKLKIVASGPLDLALRISKVQIYASMDPNQRPV